MSSLDRIAREVAEAGAHAGQSSVDDIARTTGRGASSADEVGRAAGRAGTAGDKAAGSQSNAGQMDATNSDLREQGARESSWTDVWTHTGRGYGQQGTANPLQLDATAADMSAAFDRFRSDPTGYLESRVGNVLSQSWSGASVVAADIRTQTANLLHLDGSKPPQGVLQHIGLGFQLLTTLEQLLTMWMAAIPFPAFPALRVTDQDIGLPHAHPHPPNLIPPAPPVPLPSTGPVIPIPLLSGASRTLINGMPAARCGDLGLGVWCGGYFPMYEVFLGSSSVWIEGARAARLLVDITKHCIFSAPKPSDPPLGPMVGMTMMGSPNVLVGGVPVPSLLSMAVGAAFTALFKSFAKGLQRLRGALGKTVAEASEHADDAVKAADDMDTLVDQAPVTEVDTLVDNAPVTEVDTLVDNAATTADATNPGIRASDIALRHAGFGDDVVDLVGRSPNMQRQLAEFQASGGSVRYTKAGESGSFYNPASKEVAIDPSLSPQAQTSVLAHELGHATNPVQPPRAGTAGRDEYVQGMLRDEAYAQHSAGVARNEIVSNGGSDIGPPTSGDPARGAEYQSISNELQNGSVNHDVAMDDMADLMRNETTSNTGQNYADYYGQHWDSVNSVWATP